MSLRAPIPILRIFDAALARSHYVGWLGFRLDWEHRFEPGLPLYMQISRDEAILHLSEHYGDASPGARVIIGIDDVRALHAELAKRPNPRSRPGVEKTPWGALVMEIVDPFGNRLTFSQKA